MKTRLSSFIKNNVGLTRSKLDQLFDNDLITVNDQKVNLSYIIKETDIVKVNGVIIENKPFVYYLYNKPVGVISTNDTSIKESYLNFINLDTRVFCVGRLDKLSCGLMLLTNDGKLADSLLNPETHVEKEYIITTYNEITDNFIEKMKGEIYLDNSLLKKVTVEIIDKYHFSIVLTEGKYHQIRRMVKICGNKVKELMRIRIAKLTLKDIKEGEVIQINKESIN